MMSDSKNIPNPKIIIVKKFVDSQNLPYRALKTITTVKKLHISALVRQIHLYTLSAVRKVLCYALS